VASAAGRFYLWRDHGLYIGPDVSASVHAHHAMQVCVGISGGVRLRGGPGTPWHSYDGAVIPSNQPHETDVPAELLASIWLEPDSRPALRLLPDSCAALRPIDPAKLRQVVPRLRACWRAASDSRRAAAVLEECLDILAIREMPQRRSDARAARARELLDDAPGRRISLADLAERVALSPSRLAHLLRAELGMPPRRYLLWLRLRDALAELTYGAAISDAAQAAGFADAAHLSRTFRRMLGFTPSTALRVSKFVQDEGTAS
jgi:AraC-like DNA-binding protein